MGKKHIIELENDQIIEGHIACPMQIGYRDRPSFIIDTGINITPYTEPDLEQVRKEAYENGLSDAWECVDKINSMSPKEQEECFGREYLVNILELEPSEAIEKIRQYEQEKEEQIQVGDEIEAVSGKAVVVYVDDVDEHKVRYVYSNGVYAFDYIDKVTKTGRHFHEIAEVLQKMKEK